MNIDISVVATIGSTLVLGGVMLRSNALIMKFIEDKMEIYKKNTDEKIESAIKTAALTHRYLETYIDDTSQAVEKLQTQVPLIELSLNTTKEQMTSCQKRCDIIRQQNKEEGCLKPLKQS